MILRRVAWRIGLASLGGLVTLALSASTPKAQEPASERAVLVYDDGHMEARAAVSTTALDDTRVLDHVWVWSSSRAPRRLDPESLDPEGLAAESLPDDRNHLAIRVVDFEEELPEGLRLLAAPIDMWDEVYEDLLPSWPVPENGRLSVPLDPRQAWRLRLVGAGKGAWWLDVPARKKNASLRVAPAADHGLKLLDAGGEILPSASVTVLAGRAERGHVLAQYRPNEDGEVKVPSLPDSAELTLVVAEPRHAPAAITARPSSLPGELRLSPGGTVSGRFVDRDSAPVAGARARAEAWISPRSRSIASRSVESDAEGRFSLTALPDGQVALAAAADGFAAFNTRIELEGEPVDLGDIRLAPGFELPIVVLDDADEPVAGASLTARPGLEATTDHQGRAQLEDLSGTATVTIAAKADGYMPASTTLTPPYPRELRVTMQRALRLAGRFVESEGLPVVEGKVRIEIDNRYSDHDLLPGGRFEVDLPPDTSLGLVLQSPMTQELRVRVEPGLPGELRDLGDLAAPPGITVRGRLLRADASPVAGGRVWTPRPSARGDVVAWVHRDLLETRSLGDGTFEIRGLPRRPALLRCEAPGLARAHVALDPEPDVSDLDVGEVLMSEGAELRILAAEDTAAGADSTEGAVARVDLRNEWLELDMLTATVAGGEAILRHVPPGWSTVTVVAGREVICEQEVDVTEDDSPIEVDCLDSGMRVSGTVTAGGEPAGPGKLTWLPRAAAAVPGIIMNRETALGALQQETFGAGRPQVDVDVDPNGYFQSEKLRPGAWEVVWIPLSGSMSDPEDTHLPQVDEHRIDLSFGRFSVSGQVMDADDQPVAGARVRDLESSAWAISRPDGSFTVVGLEPGLHKVHARREAKSSKIVEVVLEPDRAPDPVTLVLEERPDDRIEILVQRPDGGPAAGVFVFLESDRSELRILTTDRDGMASASLRPPYPQSWRAALVSAGRWSLGAWLSAEQAREGITLIVPEETGSLRVESLQLRGSPTIVSQQGWDLSGLLTRIGARPFVSPGLPLVLNGLPEGDYELALGDSITPVTVRADESAAIEIP